MALRDELLRRLEGAAVAAGAGDELPQPGYSPLNGLQIGPDGSVAYDFEGHISARGVDLLAGDDETPPDDRKVRWTREADGALVGEVLAFSSADDTVRFSSLRTLHGETSASLSTGVQGGLASAGANAGDQDRTIVDGFGRSSFVQQSGGAFRTIFNAGVVNVFFPGSAFSNLAGVAHGCAATPFVALGAVVSASGIGAAIIPNLSAVGPVSFQVLARTADGTAIGPGNVQVYWIACSIAFF